MKQATFQVESDWHLEQSADGAEYSTWDKDFPVNGDFLLLAGDCGRVNPWTKAGTIVDHFKLYEEMLTRASQRSTPRFF
jgi:hypothetical protein